MMQRRPATCLDGVNVLRNVIARTEKLKDSNQVYAAYWSAADRLMNGTWTDNMLMPLCESSDVTSFLFKTVCPILEEIMCNPDEGEKKVDAALRDRKTPEHVADMYKLLQALLESAEKALERDIDADLKTCAKEVIKMMDDAHVCEAMRLLSMSSVSARVCMRIGIPRMTDSFLKDTCLQRESMTPEIMQQIVGL